MKRSLLALMGMLGLCSACYIDFEDGVFGEGYGDLTIEYRFDGQLCDRAGVARIQIAVEGLNAGDGYYDTLPCGTYRDGVVVYDMLSDRYELRIDGLSSSGRVLYSMARPVLVRVYGGVDNRAFVDVGPPAGDLRISWDLPQGVGCDLVDQVQVRLRDPYGAIYDDGRYVCSLGSKLYDALAQGAWTVELWALDARDRVLYRLEERVVEVVGQSFNQYSLRLE